MAKAFRTNINLNGNQLLNALAHPASAAPTALGAGQLYYNTTSSTLNVYNGSGFDALVKSTVSSLSSLTTIGTGTGIVYSTAGALTVYGTSGTGTTVALTASPVFTTPTLGVATATSVNGLSLTASAIGFTVAGGTTSKTLTISNTLTLAGTDTSTLNIGSGGTLGTAAFTASTSYLASSVTALPLVTSVNGTTIPSSGTLLTSASTIFNGLTVTPLATGFSLAGGTTSKTLTLSNTLTLAGTDTSTLNIGAGGTLGTAAFTASTAYLAASTTSLPLVTSINGLNITASTGTLTIPNATTLSLSGAFATTLTVTAATSVTLPTSGTLVNTAVASLPSLGTVLTTLNGFVSATSGVLSASSTITGASISGNITGNAANVTGVVGLTNGGTGANLTITPGGIVYGGASVMAISAAGTAGYLLTSGGASNPTWTQSTATNVNSTVVQRDSSGNIAVSQVTVTADPISALQVATKQYVDNFAAGYSQHEEVVAATTTDFTTLGTWGIVTYTAGSAGADGGTGVGATLTPASNGILVIDNVSPVATDRVLIKNQTTSSQNGIYVVTSAGSAGTKWTLTRAADYDNHITGQVVAGNLTFVQAPASEFSTTPTNQGILYAENAVGTGTNKQIIIGTNNITFAQLSGATTITAGSGIGVAGNTVSIALGTVFDTAVGSDTTGLSLSSNTLKVRLNSAGGLTSTTAGIALTTPGTGLVITSNAISYATGSTAQTATGASGGAYSYATQKQSATITTDGATTSWAINHNFASRDVVVRVYQTSAGPDTQYADIEFDVIRTSTSVVTIASGSVITTGNTYNVVIVG